MTLAGGVVGIQMSAWKPVQTASDGSHLVVLCSHDCDIENPRDRTGLLIAPLIKVPASVSEPEFTRIMGSWQHSNGEYEHIPLYPLTLPSAGEEPGRPMVVDFSAIISLGRPAEAAALLLSTKMFEMTDDGRKSFKTKLAAFVGRP